MEKYLKMRHAAMMLGITVVTLRQWIADGRIPCYRPAGPNGKILVAESDLEELLQKAKHDAKPRGNPLTDWWRAPKK